MIDSPVPSVETTSKLHTSKLLCPKLSCVGTMEPDSRMGTTTDFGLVPLVCPTCKHTGYQSLEGVRVLFATRHEYVCSYGPSLKSLTVVFSSAALTLLRNKGLCPTQSALCAAHWALLCGQLVGIVRVLPDSPVFQHYYSHVEREIGSRMSGPSTDTFLETPSSLPQEVPGVEGAMRGARAVVTTPLRLE